MLIFTAIGSLQGSGEWRTSGLNNGKLQQRGMEIEAKAR